MHAIFASILFQAAAGSAVSVPQNMLGYYYFIDDCPESRLNVPSGMLSSGNAVFLSFITDDNWDESNLHLAEVAQKIKTLKPDMYVAYSIGGQVGSSNQALYDFLSGISEEDIAKTILGWKYVDGIDWDLEPPSGGISAKYGEEAMAKKLASISSKVEAGGKHVTMAGFGAWVWDQKMATLNGELINSGTMKKYGVMVYPPAQGSGQSAIQYFTNNWAKGAQTGPSDIRNHGVEAKLLAGGISGTATVDEAVSIAKTYNGAGATSAIVWMVKPDKCATMTGWVAKNGDLPKWSAVLSALGGSTEDTAIV